MKRVLATIAPLLALTAAVPAGGVGTGAVTIEVEGLRSSEGLVRACLTANPATFPNCRDDPDAQRLTIPAARAHELAFAAVPPGRWAVSLLHDENGNGRVDKALMVPREGFGFSRNAAVVFGPPRFGAAAFEVGSEPVHQSIRIRYIL